MICLGFVLINACRSSMLESTEQTLIGVMITLIVLCLFNDKTNFIKNITGELCLEYSKILIAKAIHKFRSKVKVIEYNTDSGAINAPILELNNLVMEFKTKLDSYTNESNNFTKIYVGRGYTLTSKYLLLISVVLMTFNLWIHNAIRNVTILLSSSVFLIFFSIPYYFVDSKKYEAQEDGNTTLKQLVYLCFQFSLLPITTIILIILGSFFLPYIYWIIASVLIFLIALFCETKFRIANATENNRFNTFIHLYACYTFAFLLLITAIITLIDIHFHIRPSNCIDGYSICLEYNLCMFGKQIMPQLFVTTIVSLVFLLPLIAFFSFVNSNDTKNYIKSTEKDFLEKAEEIMQNSKQKKTTIETK